MATTLYLVRHGETEENARGVFQGQTGGTLSEVGKEQPKAIREKLAEIPFDIVLSSDLKRCIDTASIALEGISCDIIKEPLLRERDLGNLTGKQIKGATLNETVENEESLKARANKFIEKIKKQYDNKKVLAFSHGFFGRVMQAEIEGVTHRDVTLLDNCEIRKFVI